MLDSKHTTFCNSHFFVSTSISLWYAYLVWTLYSISDCLRKAHWLKLPFLLCHHYSQKYVMSKGSEIWFEGPSALALHFFCQECHIFGGQNKTVAAQKQHHIINNLHKNTDVLVALWTHTQTNWKTFLLFNYLYTVSNCLNFK